MGMAEILMSINANSEIYSSQHAHRVRGVKPALSLTLHKMATLFVGLKPNLILMSHTMSTHSGVKPVRD